MVPSPKSPEFLRRIGGEGDCLGSREVTLGEIDLLPFYQTRCVYAYLSEMSLPSSIYLSISLSCHSSSTARKQTCAWSSLGGDAPDGSGLPDERTVGAGGGRSGRHVYRAQADHAADPFARYAPTRSAQRLTGGSGSRRQENIERFPFRGSCSSGTHYH